MRAAFMRSLIEAGETNPYRIIHLLYAHERRYRAIKCDGGVQYQRHPVPTDPSEAPAGTPATRPTSFRGQPLMVPYHTTDNLHDFIIDFIAEHGPFDCIVELGCGYGRNLFEIFYGGGPRHARYFGGELTESGVGVARDLAALAPEMDATFFHFDYLDPDLAAVPRFGRTLVFTVHSIEQVNMIDARLFGVIAGVAREVTCIHLEPFGFQFADLGPVTKLHRAMMERNHWNLNFGEALLRAQDEQAIRVKFVATELFLPADFENPTSLAIWESGAPADAVAGNPATADPAVP